VLFSSDVYADRWISEPNAAFGGASARAQMLAGLSGLSLRNAPLNAIFTRVFCSWLALHQNNADGLHAGFFVLLFRRERSMPVEIEEASSQTPVTALLARLSSHTAKVGVIGLGYVGLTIAVELAPTLETIGFEIDAKKIFAVGQGTSYIEDVSDAELGDLVARGRFRATEDFSQLALCDVIIICTPTPLRRSKEPDVSYIVAATKSVQKYLRPGQLIVLESTTYPGTTDELLLPMLSETGLQLDRDFLLAFSPERVDPGNPNYRLRNVPKVVGGCSADSTTAAAAVYRHCCDTVHIVTTARAAETTKLLENTFRHVNIALANEIARLCRVLSIDPWEVIDAAATKPFGFMPFYPGPGVGGHCIPLDPLYLTWKARQHGFESRFIGIADQINTAMPAYVADLVSSALNTDCKSVKGSKVLVLGVAYKRDIGDVRESPALPIIDLLRSNGALVAYHDPLVSDVRFDDVHTTDWKPAIVERERRAMPGVAELSRGRSAFLGRRSKDPLASTELTDEVLRDADCVLIHTDHSAFDYDRIVRLARLVVDTRNVVGAERRASCNARVVVL